MSSGQRPRRREYYPRMKVRGKNRPRRARVIVHGADGLAVWPQPVLEQPDQWATFLTDLARIINSGDDQP